MNMSNQGVCIHGREFCLECNDKKIPRRPESIGQAHRIMCQMRATIEQQQAEIEDTHTENADKSQLLARYLGENKALRNPWISVDDRLPTERALFYTPNTDEPSRYRIVPAGLAKITTDATHWAPLPPEPPA